MTIRVGVVGAGGRMGAMVCRAVHDAADMDLVAAVDPNRVGESVRAVGGPPVDMVITSDVEHCVSSGAEVIVDFTVAAAARANLAVIAAAGLHAVVGTTGFEADDLAAFERLFVSSNCVIVSNFAISAVLMMRFAEIAAPFFDTAEIIEVHHNAKVDAPSGTAMTTAARMAAASDDWLPDPTELVVASGARGALASPGGIRVHAVRMHGTVAHQEVILGAEGQTLTIRQDSYDRASYMPGVTLAIRRISEHAGLTIGLESLLGI